MPGQFLQMALVGGGAGVVHPAASSRRAARLDRRPQMKHQLLCARRRRARRALGALTGCPQRPTGHRRRRRRSKRADVRRAGEQGPGRAQLREINAAGWTQSTDITVDTQYLNARVTERILEFFSRKAGEAQGLRQRQARSLHRALAHADQARRERAGAGRSPPSAPSSRRSGTELEAMYGEGKYCPAGKTVLKFGKDENGCKNLDELGEIIATSRNYDELTEAWTGWHSIAQPDARRSTSASSSSPTKARASSASRTSACCGARVTTCRRRISRRKPRGSTTRSSRCTKACTATRAASSRRNTARTRCRTASRSRRTCSATCGRSSGTASMTTC